MNRKTLFIFEGVDRVGKSSIIDVLAKEILEGRITIVHSKGPKKDVEPYVYQRDKFINLVNYIVKEFTTDSVDHIILDRSHLGELVYGQLRDSTKDYSYVYSLHAQLLQFSQQLKVFVVNTLILTPIFKDDSTPYGNGEELEKQFIEVYKNINGIRLVFNNKNFKSLDEKLKYMKKVYKAILNNDLLWLDTIKQNSDPYYVYTMFSEDSFGEHLCNEPCNDDLYDFHVSTTFYGKHHGHTIPLGINDKVIFVGEAPGIKGCGLTGIPFYGDRSGMLLRTVLLRNGINPDLDITMTNAYWCNPPANKIAPFRSFTCNKFKNYFSTFDRSNIKIVALGRTAETKLNEIGITPDYHVKHPAYYLYTGRIRQIFIDYRQMLQQIFPHKVLPETVRYEGKE